MRATARGEASRERILDAILDLPLGASVDRIGERVGMSGVGVADHVHRMAKQGRVRVIKRAFAKCRVIVPTVARVSIEEREWLKLGARTARAILAVAEADGGFVRVEDVAARLGWTRRQAKHHLVKAKEAGFVRSGRGPGRGYVLASRSAEDSRLAGLNPRVFRAIDLVARTPGGRVTIRMVATELGCSWYSARWYLRSAVRARLLRARFGRGPSAFSLGPLAERLAWAKARARAPERAGGALAREAVLREQQARDARVVQARGRKSLLDQLATTNPGAGQSALSSPWGQRIVAAVLHERRGECA